jgi:hypothetical protein
MVCLFQNSVALGEGLFPGRVCTHMVVEHDDAKTSSPRDRITFLAAMPFSVGYLPLLSSCGSGVCDTNMDL